MLDALKSKKVVLVSDVGYSMKPEYLLPALLDAGCELFCVVGIDCEFWEEAVHEVAVGGGINPRDITTTSHPRETEDDVIEFAEVFSISGASGMHVIRI